MNGCGNASGKPKAEKTDEILRPVGNDENDWLVWGRAGGHQVGRQRLSGGFHPGRCKRPLAEFAHTGL
jgi:hypothetical protein